MVRSRTWARNAIGTRGEPVAAPTRQAPLWSARRCGACLRLREAPTGAESSVDRFEPRSSGRGGQLSLTGDLDAMRSRIVELEADNAHLRGMLKISEQESKRPGSAPTVMFDAAPGTVTAASSAREKVAFYANLFRARSDVYAVRWDSDRTGRGGWMPAVLGGFRKGQTFVGIDQGFVAVAAQEPQFTEAMAEVLGVSPERHLIRGARVA